MVWYAMLCYIHLLAGWQLWLWWLATIEPGSFSFNGEAISIRPHALEHFASFSFITLTTVGYGNEIPLTPRANALVIAEAIAGQLYLAVLLARLVALEIASRRQE